MSRQLPANVVPIERLRDHPNRGRKRPVRPKTIAVKRLTKRELELGRDLYPTEEIEANDDGRPRTRGDCENGIRPCPYSACRHNLLLDVAEKTGGIKLNFPDREPWEVPPRESCALDVAAEGGATLDRVGDLLNISHERIRQLEEHAIKHFLVVVGPSMSGEMREILMAALNRKAVGVDYRRDAECDWATGSRYSDGDASRRPDMVWLSTGEIAEVERQTNEVRALLGEGVPLPEAQRRANLPFDGEEDPPVCIAPPLDD